MFVDKDGVVLDSDTEFFFLHLQKHPTVLLGIKGRKAGKMSIISGEGVNYFMV
jgi:hypothetical protein